MHGLLIIPEMGPTVRLATVFTSIENLPIPEGDNPHAWVTESCDHCRLCARKCPVGAIYTEPIEHPDGRLTCARRARKRILGSSGRRMVHRPLEWRCLAMAAARLSTSSAETSMSRKSCSR